MNINPLEPNLTSRILSGVTRFLSTLPVAGSTTSSSNNWTYKRTLSPSRGISIHDPLLEWMAAELRMSGKLVSGVMSMTPQMYSDHIVFNVPHWGSKQVNRPVWSPSIVMPKCLRTHECAPSNGRIISAVNSREKHYLPSAPTTYLAWITSVFSASIAVSRCSSVTCHAPQNTGSGLSERTDLNGVRRLITCKFNGTWPHRSVYSQSVLIH